VGLLRCCPLQRPTRRGSGTVVGPEGGGTHGVPRAKPRRAGRAPLPQARYKGSSWPKYQDIIWASSQARCRGPPGTLLHGKSGQGIEMSLGSVPGVPGVPGVRGVPSVRVYPGQGRVWGGSLRRLVPVPLWTPTTGSWGTAHEGSLWGIQHRGG